MASDGRPDQRWVFAPTDPENAERLAIEAGVSPAVAQLLLNRGVEDAGAARTYLRPELSDLHDPSLLPGVDVGAARIAEAVRRGERLVIYGDFDVDGVSATTILMGCVALAGGRAEYYLPDREEEGYGLNVGAVRRLAAEGANLIVTVDCGVTAVEEARLVRELGVDLIVTDHHEPGPELPEALAVINPRLPGGAYPFKDLAGAGVAFKLAWAVARDLSPSERVTPEFRAFLLDAVCLAALGSIADVVPLRGENRILARFGLRGLAESSRPGLRALRETAALRGPTLTAFDVSFKLAPRLNAAGRLGSARRAVELLTTQDERVAEELARELDEENQRRREIQNRMTDEALAMVEDDGGVEGSLGLVLAAEGWARGIVGIVAGQVSERLARPTVAIAMDGDVGHGSGRSGGYVNLYEALLKCEDLLVSFGGHRNAAGLRIARDRMDAFRERFQQALAEQVDETDLVPRVDIEMELPLAEVTDALTREIEQLAPFGSANPRPLFATCGARLIRPPRSVGTGGKHLSLWVTQEGVGFRAIAFGRGDMAADLERAGVCSIAYVPHFNDYRGRRTLELEVKDIKVGEVV